MKIRPFRIPSFASLVPAIRCVMCGRGRAQDGSAMCRRCSRPRTAVDSALERSGMSVREAAREAGVGWSTAWRAAQGLPVSQRSAEKLSRVLGVPADELRRGAPSSAPVAAKVAR